MLTRSPQCVHSVEACSAGVTPVAVPYHGLSASGERPRQPLMHSSLPGLGMYGISAAYGFGIEADALRPSISERCSQFVQNDPGPDAIAFESAHRSSSSQSPTWIVWVTMSGYEYCGIAASSRPGWFWP